MLVDLRNIYRPDDMQARHGFTYVSIGPPRSHAKPMPDRSGSARPRQRLPAGHPPVATRRIGVLLLNLGTPDGTGYWPMRRYLKEFLSDPRVIELPRWKWWPILNLIILTVRPGARAGTTPRSGTRSATRARSRPSRGRRPISSAPRLRGERVIVDWAMRYANPSTAAARALQAQGCERILLVPLYPQYAAATTATAATRRSAR